MLRKLHLDEFPQVWNVLRGDMSLVGPRPERPVFVEELSARSFPSYVRRLKVRPGITGWAQVKHKYDESHRGCQEEDPVRPLLHREHVPPDGLQDHPEHGVPHGPRTGALIINL